MRVCKCRTLPKCDVCKADGTDVDASYDTRLRNGQHAYLCGDCFEQLGTAPTTKLELRVDKSSEVSDPNDDKPPYKRGKLMSSLEDLDSDSVADWECPHCGDLKALELDASGDVTCESCKKMFEVQDVMSELS